MSLRLFWVDMKTLTGSASILLNIKGLLFNHTQHLLFLFRLGQDLYRLPVAGKFFGFIIEYLIRVIYASDISCRAKVDAGFVIMHGHDIVIGSDVVIGKGCKIFNGVTLGNKDTSPSGCGKQPVVGDNVLLSTGAKILGPIKVGNNVVVGANSVVITDCPENTVVAGVPSKIVKVLS